MHTAEPNARPLRAYARISDRMISREVLFDTLNLDRPVGLVRARTATGSAEVNSVQTLDRHMMPASNDAHETSLHLLNLRPAILAYVSPTVGRPA
ncbi:hypothetical protein ACIGBL_33645 [Streptomyces sp. NPDC085614]|uniref:hypothetical protein n=1 Tax=Streptomyces sp. NPDC085614 TaxID=3365733 RepID=UPI0037D5D754